jgi:hypothetical protein|tara:strand:+ start:381 stop:731 length:351 start_codon:yes stop_codon:yes gene_type:complete
MNTPHIPTLTEPGVSYFLRSTLKKCNETKSKYFNVLWNLGLLFFFVALLGIILIYKKNTKLTVDEKKAKHEKGKQYVLEKIKSLNEIEKQKRNETITTLPKFESNFMMLHKNYYKI